MTRAEHKRALERAVGLQTAAVREMRGQVFLPRLNRDRSKDDGDVYDRTVEAGKAVLERHHIPPGSRSEKIISYYSRKDVQQAVYGYAQGRKICVLRSFHPMFGGSQLRKPEDLLPIMAFYSQDPGSYPSIHGTVSRRDVDGKAVCDLVVEVDFKKSRARSFSLSRPIVVLLRDMGVEFRVKFSGNASPHIIIPAEAFPERWRNVSRCRGLYGRLLDFFGTQISSPKTLDGSFRNPSHFLRMPYSLNENTGLVSLPIRADDFDRFSWEMARPETAAVMYDWWGNIPEDAPERTESLIETAFGQRKTFDMNQDTRRQHREALLPQMPDTLGFPVQVGMVKAGEGIAARGFALMKEPSIQEALRELQAFSVDDEGNEAKHWQQANAIASRYGLKKDDVQLMWQWSRRTDAMAYYSRPEVQKAIYSYVQERCIRMEGTEEFLTLNEPEDVFGLAAYMVGGGVAPAFRCTNARYDLESGEMTACDMVIQVDQALGKPVALLLRGFDMPSFVLYSGGELLRIVIPFEVLKAGMGFKSPLQQLPNLAKSFELHLRRMLGGVDGIHVSLYEGSTPSLYSLAGDGDRVNIPVGLSDVPKLSPDMASLSAVDTLEGVESFIPPDSGEKLARFFNDVIL